VTTPDKSHLVPRESLSDIVYGRLRDEIMHGEIADGTELSQVQLAARYGVSRIPIREALRRLQAESLVIATPYFPYVVRNVTTEQVLDLVDIRAALEDLALSKREALTKDEIADLRAINQKLGKGEDAATFLSLDRKLHRVIAGPETVTCAMIDDVRDKVHKYLNNMASGRPGRKTAALEHAGIIDALAVQDKELARQLLHEHIMQSRAFIISRLEPDERKAAAAAPSRR
jgi:DNA-binding GntR family transcriptional regulator